MLTAAKEGTFSASSDPCVLFPLAAAGVYPKTRVWGSEPENLPCSSATPPLKIELRWGCEESSRKTAAGSGVTFKYDPFGRRIYKSSSNGTSIFAYDRDNLIEETSATGAAVARYSHGLHIDQPLAMLRSSVTSYYDADGLGSVTSLSNSTGGLAQTYAYDSFGKETSSSGSLTNPFQYTARELDPETNLYEYRARYFDPSVGRFINEDPTRFEDDVNLFSYVGNDSVNLKDPLGLYKIDASCDCPSKDKLKKAEGSALGNLTFLTNTRMTACMRKKITNGTVKCARGKCENSDPKTGWAGLSLPKFGNTTQICVTAIGASDDFLACTIIHEFAHKCSIKSEGSIENVEHQVPWCAATVN